MSHVSSKNDDLHFTENQLNTKETLPIWIMPPFLLCKDNTIFSEIQIPFLKSTWGSGASMAKNCDILRGANKFRQCPNNRIMFCIAPVGGHYELIKTLGTTARI